MMLKAEGYIYYSDLSGQGWHGVHVLEFSDGDVVVELHSHCPTNETFLAQMEANQVRGVDLKIVSDSDDHAIYIYWTGDLDTDAAEDCCCRALEQNGELKFNG